MSKRKVATKANNLQPEPLIESNIAIFKGDMQRFFWTC